MHENEKPMPVRIRAGRIGGHSMKKVFIDGAQGTTGLRIHERLNDREDLELIRLPEEKRKDPQAIAEALNASDLSFLCLPDDAAREAVSMVTNPETVILDTSTAHRTCEGWAYGFPELSGKHREAILKGKRIAVPGCHASGFIALVYPLVHAGILDPASALSCFSLTGYSGGGKKMIAQYEEDGRSELLSSPRQYGLTQQHKHLKEMVAVSGMTTAPAFCPIVADFYSGMEVTVPVFPSMMKKKAGIADILSVYKENYQTGVVTVTDGDDEGGFLASNAYSGKDGMWLSVYGQEERILLVARYDNLGKGASGAAVQCMNLVLGCDETKGLVL